MIKKRILNYLADKPVTPSKTRISYDHFKKTAILFTEDQDNEALIKLTQGLIEDGKEVYTLMMVDNAPKEASYPHPHLSEKDVSFSGKISATRLKTFFESSFDLLLVLCETQSTLSRFVISRSDAPLRAGYFSEPHTGHLLNLMIKPNDKSNHNELLTYLRKIV